MGKNLIKLNPRKMLVRFCVLRKIRLSLLGLIILLRNTNYVRMSHFSLISLSRRVKCTPPDNTPQVTSIAHKAILGIKTKINE